jgi:hypothetical protein
MAVWAARIALLAVRGAPSDAPLPKVESVSVNRGAPLTTHDAAVTLAQLTKPLACIGAVRGALLHVDCSRLDDSAAAWLIDRDHADAPAWADHIRRFQGNEASPTSVLVRGEGESFAVPLGAVDLYKSQYVTGATIVLLPPDAEARTRGLAAVVEVRSGGALELEWP